MALQLLVHARLALEQAIPTAAHDTGSTAGNRQRGAILGIAAVAEDADSCLYDCCGLFLRIQLYNNPPN
nr:hypothetical protein [Verminephrobacter aporrectodeae]